MASSRPLWRAPSCVVLGIVVVLAATLLLDACLDPASAAASGNAKAKALKTLVRKTKALPNAALPSRKLHRLERSARHAKRVGRKRPCRAVKDLNRYRKVLDRTHPKHKRHRRALRERLAKLGPLSLEASKLLLQSKRARPCGGGVKPSKTGDAKVHLISSDANGFQAKVKLPDVGFAPRIAGGRTWTQLTLPDSDTPANPGEPALPASGEEFGVPDGATINVDTQHAKSYKLDHVDVFPAQPDPVDDTPRPNFHHPPYSDKPFEFDRDAYKADSFVPANPASAEMLGSVRDVRIGGLQIPAVQYNPAEGVVKVLTSVEVRVDFNGGEDTFDEAMNSPWEASQRLLASDLVNFNAIRSKFIPPLKQCGEEMLVITNASTRPAANQFAQARSAAGIRTSVFEVGTGEGQIGTTPADIQAFIRSRLTSSRCIHPSYVTIMGDDDLVPTFPGIDGIPSDLPYSWANDADELPDLAVGRIIGNDEAAVLTAVNKIIGYETTPPTGGGFLQHAAIAAQFQDDDNDGTENRTFIQFAETVRKGILRPGLAVDRIYADGPTANPLKFNDGTDLPDALKKPTFAWDGSGADITAAWNDGRFLMIHRDHGWSDGWGTPGFGTSDVQALTNGAKLPVLMSINCSSAAYDYDETSFVGEALVNPNGGAVGAFGDTRDSPTWHNSQIGLGFVDALLPRVLPTEGPTLKQPVGNALINGKLRLAGLSPPASDNATRDELYLWHYFGDPSMQMWGGDPVRFIDPSRFVAVFDPVVEPGPGPDPPYEVNVTLPASLQGQTISLLRNGQVIGKAIAGDGTATIPASFGDASPQPGELKIAMEPQGGPAVTAPVEGVPKG